LFDREHRSRSVALLLTTVLSTIATSTVDAWRYVHIVSDAGLRAATASLIVAIAGITALVGFPAGALASNRIGRIPTVAGALVLMTLAITAAFWGPPTQAPPAIWIGAALAVSALAGNAITVSANTAITEMFPAKLRATIFGALNVAGSAGRLAGQASIALLAPALGGAAPAVGTLALVGLPAAVLLMVMVPDVKRESL